MTAYTVDHCGEPSSFSVTPQTLFQVRKLVKSSSISLMRTICPNRTQTGPSFTALSCLQTRLSKGFRVHRRLIPLFPCLPERYQTFWGRTVALNGTTLIFSKAIRTPTRLSLLGSGTMEL